MYRQDVKHPSFLKFLKKALNENFLTHTTQSYFFKQLKKLGPSHIVLHRVMCENAQKCLQMTFRLRTQRVISTDIREAQSDCFVQRDIRNLNVLIKSISMLLITLFQCCCYCLCCNIVTDKILFLMEQFIYITDYDQLLRI